jgi:hypothetical protein
LLPAFTVVMYENDAAAGTAMCKRPSLYWQPAFRFIFSAGADQRRDPERTSVEILSTMTSSASPIAASISD